MRRFVLLGIALLTLAALGAGTVSAQEQGPIVREVIPVPIDRGFCYDNLAQFDLDGNGYVGKSDLAYWFNQAILRGCEFGEPATGSCAVLDINNDGILDFNDAQHFADHYTLCIGRTNAPADIPVRPGSNDPRP